MRALSIHRPARSRPLRSLRGLPAHPRLKSRLCAGVRALRRILGLERTILDLESRKPGRMEFLDFWGRSEDRGEFFRRSDQSVKFPPCCGKKGCHILLNGILIPVLLVDNLSQVIPRI